MASRVARSSQLYGGSREFHHVKGGGGGKIADGAISRKVTERSSISEGTIVTFTLRDIHWVLSLARESGNSMNLVVCDGDALLQP